MVEKRWEEEFAGDNPPEADYSGLLTEEQMLAKFRAEVEACEHQSDWADAHGVSRQMVCEVLLGNRNVRGLLAAAMGYRMVIRFEPIDGGN